jgi:ArsR family transcriptional regulator, lead/cadmium/zinc/bismuth-responsive transcriptional repressor
MRVAYKRDPQISEATCTAPEHANRPHAPSRVDEAAIEKASRLFRAFGDPARLRLLFHLARGEMCVTELADLEKESLSTISQRLRVLRSENIIVRRRRGKHINYALSDDYVKDLVLNALECPGKMPTPARKLNLKENLP